MCELSYEHKIGKNQNYNNHIIFNSNKPMSYSLRNTIKYNKTQYFRVTVARNINKVLVLIYSYERC